ncbi:MAG: isochorismatase family protein [Burkholderiaceae bacterium]|nr:isochorismatase family protein [Burkholderiaceae bacterium]
MRPRHSAFYASPLDLLLKQMQTEEIITGLATDMCVQLTAMDGFLRGFSLKVPADCVAAQNNVAHKQAIDYMARVFKCEIVSSTSFIS